MKSPTFDTAKLDASQKDARADGLAGIKPGIYRGMDAVEYHSIPAISSSLLKRLHVSSPAHVKYAEFEQTEAMGLGSALHCAVLEPDKFAGRYFVRPTLDIKRKDGTPYARPESTIEGKAELERISAENDGKKMLDKDDMGHIRTVAEALKCHAFAAPLLQESEKEVSIFWNEDELGLCKARMDLFTPTKIGDLKSTHCAHPQAFSWEIQKTRSGLNYWIKAAWYARGCAALDLCIEEFSFVAVEILPPYGISIHCMDAPELAAAQEPVFRLAETWAECLRTGIYPCYPLVRNYITIGSNDDE